MSLPAKVLTGLIVAAGVALSIAGYFAAKGSDEAYWAPLVPVFVLIYAAIAIAVVAGLDYGIRWANQRRRFAKPSYVVPGEERCLHTPSGDLINRCSIH